MGQVNWAVQMSTGTGSTVTSAPTSSSSQATSTTSSKSTTTSAASGSTGKPVFFHYMIGTIRDAHCEQDIKDAIALGADTFALNLNIDTASWAITTVTSLFNWAQTLGFKLFFSFDMTGFSNPTQFTSYLQSYVTSSAYYQYNGLPLVSTFNGGASSFTFGQDSVNDGWKVKLEEVMANAGYPIYFVQHFKMLPSLVPSSPLIQV
jgi:glucan endo-1,3-alpha-glucosidase